MLSILFIPSKPVLAVLRALRGLRGEMSVSIEPQRHNEHHVSTKRQIRRASCSSCLRAGALAYSAVVASGYEGRTARKRVVVVGMSVAEAGNSRKEAQRSDPVSSRSRDACLCASSPFFVAIVSVLYRCLSVCIRGSLPLPFSGTLLLLRASSWLFCPATENRPPRPGS